MIKPPTGGTERLLTLRLSTADNFVNTACVYAPTLNSSGEVKDQFYESLDAAIGKIPFSEHIFLLSDFNAKGGRRPRVMAKYPGSPRNWQNERKRPEALRTVLLPQLVCDKHLPE